MGSNDYESNVSNRSRKGMLQNRQFGRSQEHTQIGHDCALHAHFVMPGAVGAGRENSYVMVLSNVCLCLR